MFSFPNLEPVCCSRSSSNYCFLTCKQISQKAGQVVWYSLLFKNFPHFVVIHTVKGFGTVNKTEVDVFLEFSCFFDDPMDVGNLISGYSFRFYLFIWFWLCWVFVASSFSSLMNRSYSLVAVWELLIATASAVVKHGL